MNKFAISSAKSRQHPNHFFNFFDDFLTPGVCNTSHHDHGRNIPLVNIAENENAFLIDVAAPGYLKNDFTVDVKDRKLTISADVETAADAKTDAEEEKTTAVKYNRKEFSFQNFSRTFVLPETVDAEKIDATYTNGILTVTLPKKEEEKKKQWNITIR